MKLRRNLLRIAVPSILIVIVLTISNLVLFEVDETEFVVITQFGKPVRSILEPGLNLKLPDPIQRIIRFDKRLWIFESGEMEFLTRDKKNIVVNNFVSWRIEGPPVLFLQAVKTKIGAEARLGDIISSEFQVALGRYNLSSLINIEPDSMMLPQMMEEIRNRCRDKADDYGIEVVDVRMKFLNFPEKNKLSVFRRMKAEREQIARKYRSEGSEEATKIRAEAEKEKKRLISEAYMNAEKTKGEAEAQAIKIYAQAFNKDPKFYKFVRTLEAYEKFIDDKTIAVFPAESELLKYLNK